MNIPASVVGTSQLDPAPGDRHVVTASDLVRHFGAWQDRASRAPVYILHRGRPRHVLTSVDIMQALCAPHDEQRTGGLQDNQQALLDLTSDIIVLCDENRIITALSRAARGFFVGSAAEGMLLDRLATPATAPFLSDAARRVLATGAPEPAEIAATPYPDRRLDCRLVPYPGGVAIIAHDASQIDDLSRLRALDVAQQAAIAAMGMAATAQINVRGYLDGPSVTLTAMTGLPADSLGSVRFVSLFAIGSRVTLGDTIDMLLTQGGQSAVQASLLVNRGDPLAVRVGLAAIRSGAAIAGIAAAIAVMPTD